MASDSPIDPRTMPNGGARRGSQGRRSFSRPSSAAQVPSSGTKTSSRDASEQQEGSKRGKKPFDLTEEVDHGILRIYNATDAPLDTMAKVLESAGGPRKLWLRKRLTKITGTRYMDMFRLDKDGAAKRKQRQIAAMGPVHSLPDTQEHPENEHSSGTAMASNSDLWTARLEAESTDQISITQDRPLSLREQAVIWKPRRPSAYSLGLENDSNQPSARRPSLARLSTAPKTTVGRSPTTPTPSKRRWTDAINEETDTSYGARRRQTRRLSLPAIIQRLEDMTGHTGLFHHINRVSVQSHLSPRLPSSRFSWMSKTRSGIDFDVSPNSPTANFGGPIPYRPDPDFESYYHEPKIDLITRLHSEGLAAMAALMEARAASMSDEQAEAHLLQTLEQRPGLTAGCADADERGVTALHIAAAYGYPRVCRYLMGPGSGPFPAVYTKRGSSVCRFARPAQDFVRNDNSLYHRILYCRQWICVGRKPPVAEQAPSSAHSEEPEPVALAVPRVTSMDGGNFLPTLPEIPNDATESDHWGMPPLSPASTRPHSILAPLNTDTNTFEIRRPMLEVPLEQEIFSHNGSPISVRICREDHNSLLTPNSFSPDVVFWPDGSGPTFPLAESLPLSNQPTSQPISMPANGIRYPSSEGLNILSNGSANGHPTPSTSFGTQHVQGESFENGLNAGLGGANSYDWVAASDQYQLPVVGTSYGSNDYEYTSSQFISNGQAPGFGYQALTQSDTSRPHYPTPPADPRQTPQNGWWQSNEDLITATSLALEQSHFPNMLWSSPAWGPQSRNDSMFQADSRNAFHAQYGRISDDQMFYEG